MNKINFSKATFKTFIFISAAFCATVFAQGFLEMPDTTELPDLERETMLKDLDIPAVRERDPDPEGGPRLNVSEFRVQGIVEFPKFGISRKEIVERVEAIRFEMMQEGKRTESGFTLDELAEVTQLMIDIEKSTQERHVGPLEVQKFVFLVREQLRKRGMTLGMIEAVADTITNYYRERGFILAKAYIPKQKVRDGVVTLTLLLGELADIEVEDNQRVSSKLIERAFSGDINQPVTNASVEESLYLINDIPGVRAQGYFSPGDQVGDTRMTVKVTEEDRYSFNLRLDNHGSENTAENRLYGDFNIYNPMGWGDELYFAFLKSFNTGSQSEGDDTEEGGSTYGAFRYKSFLFSPRWRSSLGYSTNEFLSRNVRQEGAPPIEGQSDVADVALTYQFRRSRVKNHALTVKYMDIDTLIESVGSPSTEVVKKTSLEYHFDVLNQKRRQLYIGNVSLHHATAEETGSLSEGGTTNKYISAEMTALLFFTLPFTEYSTRFLIQSALQYAGESISNLNQMSLTGPKRTRGFGVNGFQADDGFFFGVDWILSLPKIGDKKLFGESLSRAVQPYLFFDGAYGVVHPVNDGDEPINGNLANVGAGVKLNFGKFNSNLITSQIVTDDVEGLQGETPDKKVLFELQYQF